MLVYEKEERTEERKVPAVLSPPVPHEFNKTTVIHSIVQIPSSVYVCEFNILSNLIMLSATIKNEHRLVHFAIFLNPFH